MKDKICYIVGASDNCKIDIAPQLNDMVIAVDGGLKHLETLSIEPDLIIGDFDSLGYMPKGSKVVKLNEYKDDTDTLAALKEGMKCGYKNFFLYGCAGGRTEHTLANIQLLGYLAHNDSRGFLFDSDCIMMAIKDTSVEFLQHDEGYISVLSLSERTYGVNLKGLKYPLIDATLTNTYPLGVSNEFCGLPSMVSIDKGTALVIFPRKYRDDIANFFV